jgi:uncharacterized protein (DUF1800 family)
MSLSAAEATRARIALQRFGLGAKPGALEQFGEDPLAALKAELDEPRVALIDDPDLPSRKAAGRLSQKSFEAAETIRQLELKARLKKHLRAEIGFVERLVLFWSNHFSMSINKDQTIRGTIGQLERDVIRKHALGRFADMQRGVMQHPGMLRYLDNEESMGPKSEIGIAWGRGVNENLARELLELHTLGTSGGYSEADVTNMALLISGWSYVRGWEVGQDWADVPDGMSGQFYFRPKWHEPGPITFMGRTYPAGGVEQGEQALLDISRMPATAQHIAFKLVRHFITDEPTPEMVDPVAEAFLSSDGDLKATALALIALPAAWSAPFLKLRTPYELAVAQFRALGTLYVRDNMWAFTEPLRAMNNLPWERPAPDGYPDETYAWLDPDGMTIRLDTAMLAVDVFGEEFSGKPLDLGRALYGAALSRDTQSALTWLTEKRIGLTVLFMSPEFQRR